MKEKDIDEAILKVTLAECNIEDKEIKDIMQICRSCMAVYKFVLENFNKPLRVVLYENDKYEQIRPIVEEYNKICKFDLRHKGNIEHDLLEKISKIIEQ